MFKHYPIIYIYIYIWLFVNHVEVIKKKLNMLHWFGTLFFCQFRTKCNTEYKFKRVHATIIMSNNNIRRFFFCLFADNKRVFYTLVIAEIIITDNHITIFLYWRHTYHLWNQRSTTLQTIRQVIKHTQIK